MSSAMWNDIEGSRGGWDLPDGPASNVVEWPKAPLGVRSMFHQLAPEHGCR